MAQRSPATWAFVALVAGGSIFLLARTMRPQEAPSTTGASSSSGAAAAGSSSARAASSLFAAADQRADPTTLPLLGGLRLGDEVRDGWKLVGVSGVQEERVSVLLDRAGAAAMMVWIGKPDPKAPLKTEKYAISFGAAHRGDVSEAEQSQVAQAIRDRVARVEATVPAPPGL